jgi:hypothetical protein
MYDEMNQPGKRWRERGVADRECMTEAMENAKRTWKKEGNRAA